MKYGSIDMSIQYLSERKFQEGKSVGGVGAGWKWLKILPEMVWIS